MFEFEETEHPEYEPSPCYQMKVINDSFTFLINNKEITSVNINNHSLSYDYLKPLLVESFMLLKNNNIKQLKLLWR